MVWLCIWVHAFSTPALGHGDVAPDDTVPALDMWPRMAQWNGEWPLSHLKGFSLLCTLRWSACSWLGASGGEQQGHEGPQVAGGLVGAQARPRCVPVPALLRCALHRHPLPSWWPIPCCPSPPLALPAFHTPLPRAPQEGRQHRTGNLTAGRPGGSWPSHLPLGAWFRLT